MLPCGGQAGRKYIKHPGTVIIVAMFDNGKGCASTVFAQHNIALELPAGHIDPGEKALNAAKRALREETGHVAAKWTPLLFVHPCIAFQARPRRFTWRASLIIWASNRSARVARGFLVAPRWCHCLSGQWRNHRWPEQQRVVADRTGAAVRALFKEKTADPAEGDRLDGIRSTQSDPPHRGGGHFRDLWM